MTLLRDIQKACTSTETHVADLLRKCKILAVHLKSSSFDQWVDRELNGYKNKEELPDYRKLTQLHSLGNFDRGFGNILVNAPIAASLLPKQYQEVAKTEYLYEGISVYEDLISASDKGDDKDCFQVMWTDALVGILNHEREAYCLSAWKVIPRGALIRVLNAVRNKILGFALDIEKENPQAGEADLNGTPVPAPVVNQVFQSHFYGEVGNVATGSHHFEQHTTFNKVWQQANIDLSQLAKELPVLRSALINQAKEPDHYEEIAAVRSAEIEAEKKDGSKVLGHLTKVGRWGLDVATQIGTQIAVEAIKQATKP